MGSPKVYMPEGLLIFIFIRIYYVKGVYEPFLIVKAYRYV